MDSIKYMYAVVFPGERENLNNMMNTALQGIEHLVAENRIV